MSERKYIKIGYTGNGEIVSCFVKLNGGLIEPMKEFYYRDSNDGYKPVLKPKVIELTPNLLEKIYNSEGSVVDRCV